MLAGELGLAGIRSVVLDPMPGPNPQPRANRIRRGEAARILDHRGLYSVFTGTAELPKPAPRSIFAGFPLDLSSDPDSQLFVVPIQQRGLVEVLGERAGDHGVDIRWGHALTGVDQLDDAVRCTSPARTMPTGWRPPTLSAQRWHQQDKALAGIDFAGMSSYDLVSGCGFNVEAQTNGWPRSSPVPFHPCGSIELSGVSSPVVRWGAGWCR